MYMCSEPLYRSLGDGVQDLDSAVHIHIHMMIYSNCGITFDRPVASVRKYVHLAFHDDSKPSDNEVKRREAPKDDDKWYSYGILDCRH